MTFTIPSIFTAIDKISKPVKAMADSVDSFAARAERSFRKVGQASAKISKASFIVGAAIAAPLILAANEAVKFEDKMADVGKTTGLQGKELSAFGSDILDLATKTRTGIDDIVKIAEIGGQLGIAKKDLLAFTQASNKFNVAIGADFSGGVEQAITSVGNIKSLFKETRAINIADSITKTGSAINELGAVGSATSENVSDFTLRLGALPDALKPSLTNTLALGAYLEEVGINAQIGAGGVGNFLLVAGKNIDAFGKQMGMTSAQSKKLLADDPTEFAKRFAQSLNGLKPDVLAKKLETLGIGTQETIKVIGALGSGTARLTELQKLSNEAFTKGTSLNDEYNKKNNTTAAQLAKAQNNFKALTIIIGTELLPLLNDLLSKVMPIANGFVTWAKNNKALVKTIVVVAAAVAGFSFLVSGITGIVALVSSTIAAWGAITKVFTAAQWLMNAALTANPIGLIIVAIGALIALIVVAVAKYNEWGAALLFVMGPLGFIINLIQSFRRNWDMITKAFSEGGVLAGFKAIGAVILDSILMPLQQILKIIAGVTGAEWATNAMKSIEEFRKNLGVNVTTDESGAALEKPLINPEVSRQESLKETIKTSQQSVAIDINDKSGKASMGANSGGIPVKLTSTMSY